jgi:peroxiredoxin (alkyl hydroperoxide reductase subunit C)
MNTMKKIILLVLAVFFALTVWSQNSIPMLGETAPSFTAESTIGKLNFPEDYGKSWKMLFSHPKDFTPVCTSEILQLAKMQDEFNELDVKIAVISVDELSTHYEWKQYMENILLEETEESVKINFPFIDDNSVRVSNKYGMLHAWENETRDVRGVFILNPENEIQSISFYPNNIGRNLEEIKRLIIALQTSQRDQVMTPVNWEQGDDVLLKHIPYSESELMENPDLKDQYYKVGVNMWFKRGSIN